MFLTLFLYNTWLLIRTLTFLLGLMVNFISPVKPWSDLLPHEYRIAQSTASLSTCNMIFTVDLNALAVVYTSAVNDVRYTSLYFKRGLILWINWCNFISPISCYKTEALCLWISMLHPMWEFLTWKSMFYDKWTQNPYSSIFYKNVLGWDIALLQ